ncbi:AAA family ATPase [Streptomyces sp. NL15-2K]|uniref:AAA family ATPase n=1 Tax=Streptomyces sp. NL15-2K TaxID=376149 RepID=UPI0035B5303A
MLAATFRMQQHRQALALAVCLAPIAHHYDLVVLDSAPENPPLQQLALSAARWMIAPTRSDKASINDGLGSISRQFQLVRRTVNPDLASLGWSFSAAAVHPNRSTATPASGWPKNSKQTAICSTRSFGTPKPWARTPAAMAGSCTSWRWPPPTIRVSGTSAPAARPTRPSCPPGAAAGYCLSARAP